jgi:hypothetical protein
VFPDLGLRRYLIECVHVVHILIFLGQLVYITHDRALYISSFIMYYLRQSFLEIYIVFLRL